MQPLIIVTAQKPVPLTPGMLLNYFSVTSTAISDTDKQIVLSGSFEIRDCMEGKNVRYVWRASSPIGILSWSIGRSINEPTLMPFPLLNEKLTKWVKTYLDTYCKNSAVVSDPVISQPVIVVEASTSENIPFKDDWCKPKPPTVKKIKAVVQEGEKRRGRQPRLGPPRPPARFFKEPKLYKTKLVQEKLSGHQVVVERPYVGAFSIYSGVCICEELSSSTASRPFDWVAKTEKKFARRCFECSCGTRWWSNQPVEHFWSPVADDAAWNMLIAHDGRPVEPLVFTEWFEGKCEGLFLEITLIKCRYEKRDYVPHREFA